MFCLEFTYRFEAAHRFTQSSSVPCMTPHGHTWRATLRLEADGLGEGEMVEEFSRLKGGWKRFLQETADHSFFHHHEDPILPSLRENIPGFRGLPFPGDPTTEMIAATFWLKARTLLAPHVLGLPDGERRIRVAAVHIQETPSNRVELNATEAQILAAFPALQKFHGWWQESDPKSRVFRPLTEAEGLRREAPAANGTQSAQA